VRQTVRILVAFLNLNFSAYIFSPKIRIMLKWTIIFLVIALIAALLGFGGIAAGAAEIAEILFYIFIVLFLISLIMGFVRRR